VFDRHANVVVHFDSSGQLNASPAQEMFAMVDALFANRTPSSFRHGTCEQQTNGYDCGLHVLRNMEKLVRGYLAGSARTNHGDPTSIPTVADMPYGSSAELRRYIVSIIQDAKPPVIARQQGSD